MSCSLSNLIFYAYSSCAEGQPNVQSWCNCEKMRNKLVLVHWVCITKFTYQWLYLATINRLTHKNYWKLDDKNVQLRVPWLKMKWNSSCRFKLRNAILLSLPDKMCQSRRSLLKSYWVHEKILMSAFRWLGQKKWCGNLFRIFCSSILQAIMFRYISNITIVFVVCVCVSLCRKP